MQILEKKVNSAFLSLNCCKSLWSRVKDLPLVCMCFFPQQFLYPSQKFADTHCRVRKYFRFYITHSDSIWRIFLYQIESWIQSEPTWPSSGGRLPVWDEFCHQHPFFLQSEKKQQKNIIDFLRATLDDNIKKIFTQNPSIPFPAGRTRWREWLPRPTAWILSGKSAQSTVRDAHWKQNRKALVDEEIHQQQKN